MKFALHGGDKVLMWYYPIIQCSMKEVYLLSRTPSRVQISEWYLFSLEKSLRAI